MELFWVFILGCLAGFIIEGVVTLVAEGHFEARQGVIYGPFAQVYGMGSVTFYLLLPRIQGKTKIFWTSVIIGSVVEYLCSYLQEMWFGTVSWDYTNSFLNLNGRTALLYAVCWGFIGLFFMQVVYPFLKSIRKHYHQKWSKGITIVFAIFMICNFTISFMATKRQTERMEDNRQASNPVETFLDHQYPDYRMNQIYSNKMRKARSQ